MFIAKQKRKENLAEYILYMYQVEDLIRAFKLDMKLIEEKLVSSYRVDEKMSHELTDWYSNLVLMMEKEGIREKGHLQFLKNLTNDLDQFHLKLIETSADKTYISTFRSVANLVSELKQKNEEAVNDIDLGMTAIYGYLLLKIQQKKISPDTEDAIKRISRWLGYLSKKYKEFESGDLEI